MPGDALFGTGPGGGSTGELVSSSYNPQDAELTQVIRNLFQISRDYKRVRYDAWLRNYKLVNNRLTTRAANWMPSPKDSEIYPTTSALVAWMTDQNINLDFIPSADPEDPSYLAYNNLANDLSNIVYSTWLTEGFNGQVKLALWDAFQYGVGIFKNVWDNRLDGGYGNIMLKRVDPWSFYPDPFATSFADMEYCFEVRKMSLDEIERRWPKSARLLSVLGNSVDQIDERPSLYLDGNRSPMANPGQIPMSGTFGGVGASGVGTFGYPSRRHRLWEPLPNYIVYEFWMRENEYENDFDPSKDDYAEYVIHDRWRVVVMCNNHILMDEVASDLWRHGQHPYERYCFDDTGEFYGISLVDHLADPQMYINRLLTAMQHNAELVGNPIFIEGANSGLNRVGIINRPGQRLTVHGAGGMRDNKPDWLTPPQMPPSVMELVNFWIGRIENTSGLSAIVKGATPNQRNAEGVISSVQEAAFVRIRSALSNLELTLQQCAIKLADLICENYTEPRIMAIIGQDGAKSSLSLHNRHFYGGKGETPLKFSLQITAGASAPTSRAARIAEAEKLYAMRAVDDQYVLEAHQVRNIPKVLQRKYMKQQLGLLSAGGPSQRSATRKPGNG